MEYQILFIEDRIFNPSKESLDSSTLSVLKRKVDNNDYRWLCVLDYMTNSKIFFDLFPEVVFLNIWLGIIINDLWEIDGDWLKSMS